MSASDASGKRMGRSGRRKTAQQLPPSDRAPSAAAAGGKRSALPAAPKAKAKNQAQGTSARPSARAGSRRAARKKTPTRTESSQLQASGPDELQIHIADHQSRLKIDRVLLRRAVRQVLADYGFRRGVLTVALVGDRAIRRLNRLFLGEDEPTDVLSFPLEKAPDAVEGEIIVSTETACREAARYANDPMAELLLYVIHGALHLVGLDDVRARDRAKMRQAEKRYLRLFGLKVRMAPLSTTKR